MNKVIEKIELAIIEDLKELGFDLEYIEYVKELDRYVLKVVVDKIDKSLMDMEDCEKISRKIEDKIDQLMKENREYVLEVSSPGLERQLKTNKLYQKYIGYDVHIKLFKKTDVLKDVSIKEFDAKLLEVTEDSIKVKSKIEKIDVTFTLAIKDVASAHTIFDYDLLLKGGV